MKTKVLKPSTVALALKITKERIESKAEKFPYLYKVYSNAFDLMLLDITHELAKQQHCEHQELYEFFIKIINGDIVPKPGRTKGESHGSARKDS